MSAQVVRKTRRQVIKLYKICLDNFVSINSSTHKIRINNQSKPVLSDAERDEVISYLLLHAQTTRAEVGEAVEYRLPWGVLSKAAIYFDVSKRTIKRIWSKARASYANNHVLSAGSARAGSIGRTLKWDRDEARQAIIQLDFFQRESIDNMAENIGMPPAH